VLEQLDITREYKEEEVLAVIDEEICKEAKKRVIPLNQRKELRIQVFHSLRKLDVLQELLNEEDITEIMVNGANHIFYEKKGEIITWEKHFSKCGITTYCTRRTSSNYPQISKTSYFNGADD